MRSIIKSQSVRSVDPVPGSVTPRAPRHAKRVELLSIEGRVQAVELTCSCGEVSLIELDYPETPKSAQAS